MERVGLKEKVGPFFQRAALAEVVESNRPLIKVLEVKISTTTMMTTATNMTICISSAMVYDFESPVSPVTYASYPSSASRTRSSASRLTWSSAAPS